MRGVRQGSLNSYWSLEIFFVLICEYRVQQFCIGILGSCDLLSIQTYALVFVALGVVGRLVKLRLIHLESDIVVNIDNRIFGLRQLLRLQMLSA